VDLPDSSIKCPHTGFKKSCRELALSCPKFVHIAGLNPNSGEQVNKYGCVDGFLPMLLIENSQQQRQTAAAVESFRNETVRGQQEFNRLLALAADRRAEVSTAGPRLVESGQT